MALLRANDSDAPEVVASHDTKVIAKASEAANAGSKPRRVDDMKASTFWLLLGLISILVIGATVGGAVGGSICRGEESCSGDCDPGLSTSSTILSGSASARISSSSSTSPSSSSAAATSSPSSDYINGSTYKSLFQNGAAGQVPSSVSLTFTELCTIESYSFNLASAWVTTFEACIELCASLNFWNRNSNSLGVTHKPSGPMPLNCWAHNVTTSQQFSGSDSAVLVA